ncbi:FAD-dependent oxidoreductase [Azospirillum cavernae]|uniref:FAD-dependent oxidoreductase n=1 Tax=Azospirillum cavernae TaxID=2320860 RepID=A0A418VL34_9PROT|nr:UDP-galactopyranose mutase [Azospirillum cavernae]RJF76865.1 FAD-dependent oxidoreductase [Azospirillum cavernae]
MKTALIIGGGFAGCAAAHQLILMGGWDVTIVEAAPFLGAGVRTFFYGGHPYTFGPRHFLTQNEAVHTYLNAIIPLRRCNEHEFLTYVEQDDAFYSFPIHMDDIERMPDRDIVHQELKQVKGVSNAKNLEEYWIGSVGKTLYGKLVEKYNHKMWMIDDNSAIDTFSWSPKGVAIKEGPRAAWDTAISAYPYAHDGYNAYFDIATQGARVLLNTTIDHYDIPNKTVSIKGDRHQFDIIVNTISPDLLFDKCHGELGFIGRDLHKIVFPTEHVFPNDVYFLYYANDEKFTRLVEYKKFTHHTSPTTLIGMEIPSLNGRHYPLPYQSEIARARCYFEEMPDGVYSIGRAGSYRYSLDIDDCIEQAMIMADQVRGGGRDYPVPMEKWR